MINPDIPDDDEDLFREEETSTNTEFNFTALNQPLSGSLSSSTARAQSSIQENIAKVNVPEEFQSIVYLLEFADKFSSFQETGSVIGAMAELLDEMSEGKLKEMVRLKEYERRILAYFSCHEFIKWITKPIYNAADHSQYGEELTLFLNVLSDMFHFQLEKAKNNYKAQCSRLNKPIDEGLLEKGVKQKRTIFDVLALGSPPAEKDVDLF